MNSFNTRLPFYLTILLFFTSISGFVRELFTTIVLIQEVDNEDSSCFGIFINLTTLATACSCIGHYSSSQAWIPRTIVILYDHGIIISSDIKTLRCLSKSYERGLGAVLLNPESILYRKSETKYIPVFESSNEQDCYTVGQIKFNNLQSSLHDLYKLHDVKCIPLLPKRVCKKLEIQGDRTTMNPTVLKGSPVVCSGFLFGIAFPGKEDLVELIRIKRTMYGQSFGLSGSRRIYTTSF